MTKYEVLTAVKEANAIVDEMSKFAVDSEQYICLSADLDMALNRLLGYWWFTLHLSPRTGHYYVRF